MVTTTAMRGEMWGWRGLQYLVWIACGLLVVAGLLWLGLLFPPAVAATRAMLAAGEVVPGLLAVAIVCTMVALWGAWELGETAAELPPLAIEIHRLVGSMPVLDGGRVASTLPLKAEEPAEVSPRRPPPHRADPPPSGKVDDYF
jgi:hypothetical protein